jgi:signal transduction histidine kinase
MIPKTIRWRLPLSYALIALLTTLALGAILLTALRDFYFEQEQTYLRQNAAAISSQLLPFLAEELPVPALESQLKGFAFLSQTRVQILDEAGQIVADSGPVNSLDSTATLSLEVEVDGVSQAFSQTVGETADTTTYHSTIIVQEGIFTQNVQETITISRTSSIETELNEERPLTDSLISRLPAVGTPYGFGLGTAAANTLRSDQIMQQPIHGLDGRFLGTVQLSQGPAYGRAVLINVAWGWGIAGLVAMLLAGLVGWWMSWRLARPLGLLTAATTQMAAGDLSARSPVIRQDELGTLSRSFNQMAGQVEETVTALRQFVADAAHELHTPLTALRTNLEILAGNLADTTQLNRVQRAEAQVARLEALTTGLLALSRIEAKTAVPPYTPINLTALVQSSTELYASRAEQAGIVFTVNAAEPVTVLGHEEQLRQAIQNLLDNSLKFTPSGGEVKLAMRSENFQVFIRVADTGIGIPEAERAYLFGRFHRGRNATTYPGSGLGLAIVQAIVDAHQGQIFVESGSWGTAVTIQLPAAPEP